MNSPQYNMFKVKESFRAPYTTEFGIWYKGITDLLDSVIEGKISRDSAVDILKGNFGISTNLVYKFVDEHIVYGKVMKSRMKKMKEENND